MSMRFTDHLEDSYLAESNKIEGIFKKLWRMPYKQAETLMKKSFKTFSSIIKKQGKEEEVLHLINKYFTSNFRNLDDVLRLKVQEETINEDLKHFWDMAKIELWPTLSFWPALQVWLQIDKLIQGEGANFKIIAAYSLFFIFLTTGKHVMAWRQWKKDNPKEFKKEGGRRNPFAVRK